MKLAFLFAALFVFGGTAAFAQEEMMFGAFGGGTDTKTVIAIKADGHVQITTETTESRAQAEAMAHSIKFMQQQMAAGDDSDDSDSTGPTPKPDAKPMTDDELIKTLRDPSPWTEDADDESASPIDSVTIVSNTVHLVQSHSFDSLSDFAKKPRGGELMSNVRFETDADHHLRLTLSHAPGMARYGKAEIKSWKAAGVTMELRFVLPGKVLTSDLAHTDAETTWIAVDGKDPSTLDAYQNFVQKPAVITAELGGLTLDQPIDSKELRRHRRDKSSPDQAITDAGPDFSAEAQAVTISTVYHFPGSKKQTDDNDLDEPQEQPGMTVTAKLYAPRGREVLSVDGVEVLAATDDKGRALKPAGDSDNDNEDASQSFDFEGGNAKQTACSVQLRLALPQPDAQSIQELSGQAVMVTVGKWKEMVLTNIQANPSNAVDLATVLPGAKLILSKVTTKNQQTQIKARLVGPPEIRDIELKYGGDEMRAGSSTSEIKFSKKGAESTRDLRIMSFNFPGQAKPPSALTIRIPDDQRRQRFKFKLSGMDLF